MNLPITREYTEYIYSPDTSIDDSSEEKPNQVEMTDEHKIVIDYLNQRQVLDTNTIQLRL